jgi:hypothetical protein
MILNDIRISNAIISNKVEVLHEIHSEDKNIAIYDRDVSLFLTDIETLLNQSIEIRTSGDVDSIMKTLKSELNACQLILDDITSQLTLFSKITNAKSFRLLLAAVNTNMCRRFHTDVNDLRMLCTYSGPGTLWLSDDNVNRKALATDEEFESIALDETNVHQTKTGSVAMLKGALYPKMGTTAIVHRSPTIEETGTKRLLLRIDTNDFIL